MLKKISIILALLILPVTIALAYAKLNTSVNVPTDNNIASTSATKNIDNATKSRSLIVYFSRVGNTNYPSDTDATTSASIIADDNQQYGTTEYLAKLIQKSTGSDLVLIKTQQSYPANFAELVKQNHAEMSNNYLPELVEENLNLNDYDVIYIGYPIWATKEPQAIKSFLQKYDLSNKIIVPFCTHDGYGSGSSFADIQKAVPHAKVLNGIAIQAKDVPSSQAKINTWLTDLGLLKQGNQSLQITLGSTKVNGILYDTPLANEIKHKMPLAVATVNYGHREYYGKLPFTPQNITKGQLHFNDGDITYCPQNNTIAIFYAQTENPNLTMEIIPIGKVTSDLTVFDTLPNNLNISFSTMN